MPLYSGNSKRITVPKKQRVEFGVAASFTGEVGPVRPCLLYRSLEFSNPDETSIIYALHRCMRYMCLPWAQSSPSSRQVAWEEYTEYTPTNTRSRLELFFKIRVSTEGNRNPKPDAHTA
jgi:hypothetical protein